MSLDKLTQFKRDMEQAETMLADVAVILATYYKSLIEQGIPKEVAMAMLIELQKGLVR